MKIIRIHLCVLFLSLLANFFAFGAKLELQPEIWKIIISYTDADAIKNLSLTSKYLHKLCEGFIFSAYGDKNISRAR